MTNSTTRKAYITDNWYCVPLEQLSTDPINTDGHAEIIKNWYWLVDDDDCVRFYLGHTNKTRCTAFAPQANRDHKVSEIIMLSPSGSWAKKAQLVPTAFIPQAPLIIHQPR